MKYPDDFINQIIQGDCLEVMRQMPKGAVDLILTDIPYDMVNRADNGLRNLNKSDADVITFPLQDFIQECLKVSKGSIYIFCGFGQVSEIALTFKSKGLNPRLIIWEKTNPSPMNGQVIWLSGVEPCVFGKHPNATFNGSCRNTVLRYPTGQTETEHPTEKSEKLFEDLVAVSSKPGDIVLDPCNGSGTTTKVCQFLGRKFIGVDISPEYCEMAKKRLAQKVLNF